MRVLWVTDEPPGVEGGGGNIRQAHLIQAVAKVFDVDLLLAGSLKDANVRSALHGLCEVANPVHAPQPPGWRRRARDLRLAFGSVPAEIAGGAPTRAILAPHVRRTRCDIVVIHHLHLAPLVCDRHPGSTWVCELQNIQSATNDSLRHITLGRRQQWLYGREAAQSRRAEREVVRRFDHVVTVTREDAALLSGPSRIVPNGVELERFTATPLPSQPVLVFTGTLSYRPNVDGLTWFCEQVLPKVQLAVPDATLRIVGRNPVPEVIALGDRQGITVHQDVPDIRPFLSAARIAVVPLRIGSGSRLKALEAMAAARPVVGTTVGLAGLGLTDEAEFADHPDELAEVLIKLLADDECASKVAERGRRFVELQCDWKGIGSDYARLLLRAAGRGSHAL